jgi:polyisoprenoid-binding protein YceI
MTETTVRTATRQVEGVELPAPGVWEIDPGHTEVAFTGRHFLVTKVRGRFTDVRGSIHIAEDPRASHVDVVIAMASVHSGNRTRDEHLRSADLFDVERYPEATFRSSEVEWHGASGVLQGDLTIHGVTRRVPLVVTFDGHVRDPWGGDRAIYSATTEINREDFGITWNAALESGGLLVSRDVTITIDIETVLTGSDSGS